MTVKTINIELPSKIHGYTLVHTYLDQNHLSQFGVYQNDAGEKFFCKALIHNSPVRAIREAKNESQAYAFFAEHKTNSRIIIPKLIKKFTFENIGGILTNYYKGYSLEILPTQSKINILVDIHKFLHAEYIKYQMSGIKNFQTFSSIHWLLLAMYRMPLACIRNPNSALSIFFGSLIALKYFLTILKDDSKTLIHRDLNPKNIIILNSSRCVLVDFQLSCVSTKLMEIGGIVHDYWDTSNFVDKYLNTCLKSDIISNKDITLVQLYALFLSIYHLSIPYIDNKSKSLHCLHSMIRNLS